MFFVKFLENIFSNSLKDKPGPSFAYIYIFAWLIINYLYPLAFLSTEGEIALKVSALKNIGQPIQWGLPVGLALIIVIFKPWLNNFGLLAKEASDKATQLGLRKLKIKKYKTAEEYEAVTTQIESVKSINRDLNNKIHELTISKENLKSESKTQIDELISGQERLTLVNDKLATTHKTQINQLTTKNETLITENETLTTENETLITKSEELANAHKTQIHELITENEIVITESKEIANDHKTQIHQLITENETLITKSEELTNAHKTQIHQLITANDTLITKSEELSNAHKTQINSGVYFDRNHFSDFIIRLLDQHKNEPLKLNVMPKLIDFLNWDPALHYTIPKVIVETFFSMYPNPHHFFNNETLIDILYNDKTMINIPVLRELQSLKQKMMSDNSFESNDIKNKIFSTELNKRDNHSNLATTNKSIAG